MAYEPRARKRTNILGIVAYYLRQMATRLSRFNATTTTTTKSTFLCENGQTGLCVNSRPGDHLNVFLVASERERELFEQDA